MTRLDTDETYSFETGSKGGLGAVNKLVRTFGSRLAKGAKGLPVVELKAAFYKHKTYGRINVPTLHIVNWTDEGGQPRSLAADLNDSIPL